MDPRSISIIDYTYDLPPERIAHFPAAERDGSKLLTYHKGVIDDHRYTDLPSLIPPGALLVFNDTRVVAARILFQKQTGGVIEIFCLEPFGISEMNVAMNQQRETKWLCLVGGASKWKHGYTPAIDLVINEKPVQLQARISAREKDNFIIHFTWNSDHRFSEILDHAGAIPLPPYIRREAGAADRNRYQTVYAREEGSVAAPTAGLHFTPAIMEKLKQKKVEHAFVTLHVGAGTFKPVKADTMAGHDMHAESFQVSIDLIRSLSVQEMVIPVGTTSLRTLESLYWFGVKLITTPAVFGAMPLLEQWEVYDLEVEAISVKDSLGALIQYLEKNQFLHFSARTRILIAPGYRFRIAKGLITNFHQPQSTLLLLVAALIGDDWRKVYEHALKNDYRFLSYGDGSFLMA